MPFHLAKRGLSCHCTALVQCASSESQPLQQLGHRYIWYLPSLWVLAKVKCIICWLSRQILVQCHPSLWNMKALSKSIKMNSRFLTEEILLVSNFPIFTTTLCFLLVQKKTWDILLNQNQCDICDQAKLP